MIPHLTNSMVLVRLSTIPALSKQVPKPRLFTHNSPLLLVSTVGPRPQLPFLHSAKGGRTSQNLPQTTTQYQLSRLMSTERKLWLKDELWRGAKYTAYIYSGLFLVAVMTFGLQNEVAERRHHSPPDWSFYTRVKYRAQKLAENPHPDGTRGIDWTTVGKLYLEIIERLENPDVDGQGLRPASEDLVDIPTSEVGEPAWDVTSKSEPWRRGYHACLMGVAKAAENRDGWVFEPKTSLSFPREQVLGPSNPRPIPVPPGSGAKSVPREADCVPVFEPAETFYMKILTTHGFNSRQRLEAAIACADWLDFKGLPDSAEAMYDWGLDIAMGSLPLGVNNVVDIRTGIIDKEATYVSSNVLLATTSLAIHHAQNDKLAAALPILLSVLRARRQLPQADSRPVADPTSKDESSLLDLLSSVKGFLATPPYPPPPPTGDEVPTRTPTAMCEEAVIMSHIGEILFASSTEDTSAVAQVPPKAAVGQLKNRQSGLSWTRDAVDLAEATLVSAPEDDDEARDKCGECLAVGMENWSTMVTKMLKDERNVPAATSQKTGSWFWGSCTGEEVPDRWERESRVVDARLARVERLIKKQADKKASDEGWSAYLFR